MSATTKAESLGGAIDLFLSISEKRLGSVLAQLVLDGVSDPLLDARRVETVIVVMTKAVTSSVAYVSDESLAFFLLGRVCVQENGSTRVAGANIAR